MLLMLLMLLMLVLMAGNQDEKLNLSLKAFGGGTAFIMADPLASMVNPSVSALRNRFLRSTL